MKSVFGFRVAAIEGDGFVCADCGLTARVRGSWKELVGPVVRPEDRQRNLCEVHGRSWCSEHGVGFPVLED